LDSFPNDSINGGTGVDDCRWRDPNESTFFCEKV
jgi:hypothetical protein